MKSLIFPFSRGYGRKRSHASLEDETGADGGDFEPEASPGRTGAEADEWEPEDFVPEASPPPAAPRPASSKSKGGKANPRYSSSYSSIKHLPASRLPIIWNIWMKILMILHPWCPKHGMISQVTHSSSPLLTPTQKLLSPCSELLWSLLFICSSLIRFGEVRNDVSKCQCRMPLSLNVPLPSAHTRPYFQTFSENQHLLEWLRWIDADFFTLIFLNRIAGMRDVIMGYIVLLTGLEPDEKMPSTLDWNECGGMDQWLCRIFIYTNPNQKHIKESSLSAFLDQSRQSKNKPSK